MYSAHMRIPQKETDPRKERRRAKKNRNKRRKLKEAMHLLKSNGYLFIKNGEHGVTELSLD